MSLQNRFPGGGGFRIPGSDYPVKASAAIKKNEAVKVMPLFTHPAGVSIGKYSHYHYIGNYRFVAFKKENHVDDYVSMCVITVNPVTGVLTAGQWTNVRQVGVSYRWIVQTAVVEVSPGRFAGHFSVANASGSSYCYLYDFVFTVSGTTISLGTVTEREYASNTQGFGPIFASKISDGRWVVVMGRGSDSLLYAKVYNESAGVITVLGTSNSIQWTSATFRELGVLPWIVNLRAGVLLWARTGTVYVCRVNADNSVSMNYATIDISTYQVYFLGRMSPTEYMVISRKSSTNLMEVGKVTVDDSAVTTYTALFTTPSSFPIAYDSFFEAAISRGAAVVDGSNFELILPVKMGGTLSNSWFVNCDLCYVVITNTAGTIRYDVLIPSANHIAQGYKPLSDTSRNLARMGFVRIPSGFIHSYCVGEPVTYHYDYIRISPNGGGIKGDDCLRRVAAGDLKFNIYGQFEEGFIDCFDITAGTARIKLVGMAGSAMSMYPSMAYAKAAIASGATADVTIV